jgi:hypothetical protein
MRRVALSFAVAALAAGASAATASSSICVCDGDDGSVVRLAAAQGAPPLHKATPAKKTKKTARAAAT